MRNERNTINKYERRLSILPVEVVDMNGVALEINCTVTFHYRAARPENSFSVPGCTVIRINKNATVMIQSEELNTNRVPGGDKRTVSARNLERTA